MRAYLVQHGEAKSKEEDPDRSLTDKGIREVNLVVDIVSRCGGVKISRIIHSPKTRAQQTALIISETLKPEDGVYQDENLEPLADPLIWAEELDKTDSDIMLVGHLPHLDRLASYLLAGDREKGVIKFRMGGMVCLEKGEGGGWSLVWFLVPEVVHRR